MRNLPNPYEIALLFLLAIKRYREQHGKEITRLRFSARSLHRLTGRERLHGSVYYDVFEQLRWHGWTAFLLRDGVALILTTSVEGWTKVSSRRVSVEISDAAKGRLDVSKLEVELGIDDDVSLEETDETSEEE